MKITRICIDKKTLLHNTDRLLVLWCDVEHEQFIGTNYIRFHHLSCVSRHIIGKYHGHMIDVPIVRVSCRACPIDSTNQSVIGIDINRYTIGFEFLSVESPSK